MHGNGAALWQLLLEALEDRVVPATFVVNSQQDTVAVNFSTGQDASGHVSLRSAIMAANDTPGADVIRLPAGTYVLSLAGANEDLGRTGDLDIFDSLSILGDDSTTTLIDAANLDRAMQIFHGATVELSQLSIGGGQVTGPGGGIYNAGLLTLDHVAIHDNVAAGQDDNGGGIFNANGASLQINECSFTNNMAADIYGGEGSANIAYAPSGESREQGTAEHFAPTIALSSVGATYQEGRQPVVVDPNASLLAADDSPFDGGNLTVSVASATSDEFLGIHDEGTGPDQINVTGTEIVYNDATIATFTGGNAETPLVITFGTNVTPDMVQTILRNVTYETLAQNSTATEQRSITFTMVDGQDAASMPAVKTVDVLAIPAPPPPVTPPVTPPSPTPPSVTHNPPEVYVAQGEFLAQDALFVTHGDFSDPDSGTFSGTVDFGDGSGFQNLPLNADDTFALRHTYGKEGSYQATVRIVDGNGGVGYAQFLVQVFLAQPLDGGIDTLSSGANATLTEDGLTVVLERNASSVGRGLLIVVALPADALENAAVPGQKASGSVLTNDMQQVDVWDVRALNVGRGDQAVVVFTIKSSDGATPILRYLDPATATLVGFLGSDGKAPTFERVGKTDQWVAHFVLDAASKPRLQDLRGTVFVVTVPRVEPGTPLLQQPVQVVLNGATGAPGSSDGPAISRTGFVGGSERTVSTAPAQASLLDFGVAGDEDRAGLFDQMLNAHAAFWEVPVEAPVEGVAVPQEPSAIPEEEETAAPLPAEFFAAAFREEGWDDGQPAEPLEFTAASWEVLDAVACEDAPLLGTEGRAALATMALVLGAMPTPTVEKRRRGW